MASHFYNLERLHVVGIHNMCDRKFTSLAVGMVLVLVIVPLMNMRLPNFRAWVKCAYTLDNVLSSHLFWAPVFTFWVLQPGSHRRKVNIQKIFYFLFFSSPPSFCGAYLFFFIARRVQHSLSLVDREVEICVPTTKSLSTVGCCARKTSDHSDI